MQKWKLKINPEEAITNKHNHGESHLSITAKYLGINLDNKMTCTSNHRKRKPYPVLRLYLLIMNSNKLKTNIKLALYKTYIRSIITYGHQVWTATAKSHMNKVQKIQNKFLRIILNKPYYMSIAEFHEIAKMHIYQNPQLHPRISLST